MTLNRQISLLIRKEIRLEWKQKHAFNGILLYTCATVFICYLSFRSIVDIPVWNALFWIIQLFAGINAVAKSFLQDSQGRTLYYYLLTDARAMILSKIIYNFLLLFLLSVFNFLFYALLIGNPVEDHLLFFSGLLLGTMGLASVLAMVSAIASRAGNNASLMAILSFPVLLPVLLVAIRLTKNAIDGLDWSVSWMSLLMLLSLNVLTIAMAYLLFPYLWRD